MTDLRLDDPRAALPGEVGPHPVDEDADTVPHVHEENEVHEEPHHPSGEAAYLKSGYADYGGAAPDRRHAALVPVNERGTLPGLSLGGDELGDELAHLDGGR